MIYNPKQVLHELYFNKKTPSTDRTTKFPLKKNQYRVLLKNTKEKKKKKKKSRSFKLNFIRKIRKEVWVFSYGFSATKQFLLLFVPFFLVISLLEKKLKRSTWLLSFSTLLYFCLLVFAFLTKQMRGDVYD